MVDSVYRTRSLGIGAEGLPDQYADGKAAKVWEYYIGHKQTRTSAYTSWIVNVLKDRKCQTVLDVACGTGIDSMLILENGFDVTSTDASDKMLKYALKERWNRRKDQAFDKWIIEEANWLTLVDDLDEHLDDGPPADGYDAVVCLGNSFAHLPDFAGHQENQKVALENFKAMVKPGGVLVIDHRNYDQIMATGSVPAKNIYYNSDHIVDIKCSNLYVNGRPSLVTLDYVMDISMIANDESIKQRFKTELASSTHHFRLSYYPHLLADFTKLLKGVFGDDASHTVYGDFRPMGEVTDPAYYVHVIQRPH